MNYTARYDGGDFSSPSDYCVICEHDGDAQFGIKPYTMKILVSSLHAAEDLVALLTRHKAIIIPPFSG